MASRCWVVNCGNVRQTDLCHGHQHRVDTYGETFPLIPLGDLEDDETIEQYSGTRPGDLLMTCQCPSSTPAESVLGTLMCIKCGKPRYSMARMREINEARQ